MRVSDDTILKAFSNTKQYKVKLTFHDGAFAREIEEVKPNKPK